MIYLWYLDQSGFAPTLPTSGTWARCGQRVVIPHEAPQGRRVNVVGAFAPHADAGARFVFATRRTSEGRYDAAAHLAFVRRLAAERTQLAGGPGRPRVVVLDNYSVHHAAAVTAALPALATAGIRFCYLPPYSPHLNPIEAVWRQVKYQDLPVRSYATDTALQAAVETALTDRAKRLRKPTNDLPRPT